MNANEDVFGEKLEELKPIYEIVLRIKTSEEIRREEARIRKEQAREKQRKFAEFVRELKQRNVTGEEYRRSLSEWSKENP